MQYYGEIASFARTGKFFQVDLFVQQIGYVFLYPFFKLHALLFPDQSYLVLAGRLLLLAGYGLVGGLFWRTAVKRRGFSAPARALGLAAFAAWVPFQIFSPSYNSISYLLVAGAAAAWLARDEVPRFSQLALLSAFLMVLTFTYPPAGLALIAAVVVEAAGRGDWQETLTLLATTLLGGGIVTAIIFALHGLSFWADLMTAVEFSRSFGIGSAAMEWNHLAAIAAMLAACLLFVGRMHLGRPFDLPLGRGSPPPVRWTILGILLAGGAVLVVLMAKWETGYFAAAVFQAALMLLAVSVPTAATPESKLMRTIMITAIAIGGGALLALTGRWATGYFAPSVFTLLLVLAAIIDGGPDRRVLAELALAGALLGAVFSFSSGNGVHNFGIGVAGLIPFLVLQVARQISASDFAVRLPLASQVMLPGLVFLVLLNAARNPFREERGWSGFRAVSTVPAFKGIWVSPAKTEALARLGSLSGFAGKRVLVTGPHPWLYFVTRAEPATPMFFMHFTWSEQVYERVAERLFQHGAPEVIVVANGLPQPIYERVTQWSQQGCVVKNISLPPAFTANYQRLTRYAIGTEVLVLSRP